MSTSAQPHPGGPTLPSGSRVVLVVSAGPVAGHYTGVAQVPDVTGRSQGDALDRLQRSEFNSRVFNDFSQTFRRGHVAEHYPAAGVSAAVYSEVMLLVSNGPAEETAPVALPDVVGLPQADAIARLTAAGLNYEVVAEPNANVAAGLVLAQLPSQAGLAARPRRSLTWLWITIAVVVALAVSAAAFMLLTGAESTVPDLKGLTQQQAESAVLGAGLKVGVVSQQSDPQATEGTVLTQSPAANVETRKGAPVSFVVAAGKPRATVPNVVGLASADAAAAIQGAGLKVQTANKYSDSVPKDQVIDQTPLVGATVDAGSAVTISVSLGPKSANVTVPNLLGLTQQQATDKLVALGLTARLAESYSSTVASGKVSSQVPRAGQSVAPGTTIGVTVSLGAAPATSVTVPNVVGQTSQNAITALEALGLTATAVQWDGTGQPANMVVDQSPKSGDKVTTNSSVVLFVSSGK